MSEFDTFYEEIQDDLTWVRGDLNAEIGELEERIEKLEKNKIEAEKLAKDSRIKAFRRVYGVDPYLVLKEYDKIVDECIYSGGMGYKIWFLYSRDIDSRIFCNASHLVVKPDKYEMCQPTKRDLDAYRAILGREMKVTTEQHLEVWGN